MTRTPQEAFCHAIQAFEGLYQADPADVGNIKRKDEKTKKTIVIGTMRGVTPKVWAAYRGVPVETVTAADMKAITLFNAAAVYDQFYYKGPGFDRLVWCQATEVFCDIGWGSGPAVAIKMLQRMIGEHPDGVIGPRTVESYADWIHGREPAGLVHSIADMRCQFYRDIVARRPANAKFLNGWLRRANYYRPTNQLWWQTWMGADDLPPPVQQPDAAPKPAPVTPEETVQKEAETNKIVQGGTVVGSLLASMGGFFKIIPPWALGIAVLALVAVGALWALRSFGIIKRAA